MIICIAGLSGSGKNSVGKLVAQKLGLRVVDPTFKTLADRAHMSLMDFQKKAEQEHDIDKDFDAALISQTKKGNCVVTTWLGPWMVKNADMRVWLYAPRESRAMRVASRDNMTFEESLAHISNRDESNHARYKEIYGINIYDHSGFELVINTDRFMPDESAEIIATAALVLAIGNGKKKGNDKKTVAKKAPAKKLITKKVTKVKKR